MEIINRDLVADERTRILADYDQILANDGVPQRGFKRYSLVAEDDGKLIGYVSGLSDHLWLFLSDIWIEEGHRRKGIGTMLLKRLEETVQKEGLKHIYLWTYGRINPLFYEKNGYRKFAVFEDFYEVEGYHQIGYRKDLL